MKKYDGANFERSFHYTCTLLLIPVLAQKQALTEQLRKNTLQIWFKKRNSVCVEIRVKQFYTQHTIVQSDFGIPQSSFLRNLVAVADT